MYNCVIVDDEHLARKRIVRLLERHSRNFEVLAEFDNAMDLLAYIKTNSVDIIFLDIEMPELNGIDALKKIPQDIFVVFSTAYKEYALDAFENDAFDYLLKPISQERFDKTLFKIESKWNRFKKPDVEDITYSKENIELIPVQINDKTIFVKSEDISFCEAQNKYVSLHTLDGQSYLLSYSLNDLEKMFSHLIRIQKGVLVNRNEIKEIRKYFNARVKIYMNDKLNSSLVSGRSYVENIKKISSL